MCQIRSLLGSLDLDLREKAGNVTSSFHALPRPFDFTPLSAHTSSQTSLSANKSRSQLDITSFASRCRQFPRIGSSDGDEKPFCLGLEPGVASRPVALTFHTMGRPLMVGFGPLRRRFT
jgi:hypothetical protein